MLCLWAGHALPASAFTNEALTDGNALFEWGSAAFTKVACARPTYLQVHAPPHRFLYPPLPHISLHIQCELSPAE